MSPAFPCAVCGRPVRRRPATRTQPVRILCARCRYRIYDYPRLAAGVLLEKRGAVLLLRRAHAPAIGRLDIPGGFLEAGESPEAGARRELREETALSVGALEPLGLWWDTYFLRGFGRFPVLNFYFAGRWRSGTPVAADDAASAAWVPLGGLARLRSRFAWAHMAPVLRAFATWTRDRGAGARATGTRARAARRAR